MKFTTEELVKWLEETHLLSDTYEEEEIIQEIKARLTRKVTREELQSWTDGLHEAITRSPLRALSLIEIYGAKLLENAGIEVSDQPPTKRQPNRQPEASDENHD